jgi:hypothetical protein
MMRSSLVAALGLTILGAAGCQQSGTDTAGSQNSGLVVSPNGVVTDKSTNLSMNGQAAANACLSPEQQAMPIESFSPEQRVQLVTCLNSQSVTQLRTQLPVRIDPVTTLVDIQSQGPVLSYRYQVDMDASQLPPNASGQIEQQTRSATCGRTEARQLLELGGSYAYTWVDRSGQTIHSMQLSSCA